MDIVLQLTANSVIAGVLYALIALGFNLIYGATKFINMSHGAVAVAGVYAMFFCARSFGMHIWASALIGIFAAGVLGFALDAAIFSPLRARKASSLVSFVASLGIFTLLQAALSMVFGPQFQTVNNHIATHVYEIAGASVTNIQIFAVLAGLALFLGLAIVLNKTMFGKVVKAISDDEEVANMLGINTGRIISRVFFIGSAIAGTSGIFIGLDTGIQPTMGLGIILEGAIASIIGGIGNVYGGVLGAFILSFAENFGIWKIPSQWKGAIAFAILIIFLIFRPKGIFKTR